MISLQSQHTQGAGPMKDDKRRHRLTWRGGLTGVLLSMARADALLVVPAALSGHAAGDTVRVQLLDGGELQTELGLET